MVQDATPIVVGVSQQTWRDRDPQRTPVDALAEVAGGALADAGVAPAAVDALVTIPFLAQQVPQLAPLLTPNPGALLADRLGMSPALLTSDYGGNLPQWFINRGADWLVEGRHRMLLLTGAELMATLLATLRGGGDLPAWREGGERPAEDLGAGRAPSLPAEHAHGLFEPVVTYPLFESALRHARGLDEGEQRAQLGQMIAAMSTVAAANPHAWRRERLTAEAALSEADGNRIITWPYNKCMNAIAGVDMAAAVLLTTVGEARRQGIDPSRWIYLQGGAEANDVWYAAEREDFHRSPALAAAGTAALAQAGVGVEAIDRFDLYPCFPCAVTVACDSLGIAVDDPRGVTVTGGLTLFGGPGNNYSTHAIAEMVARLREAGSGRGLVTANGGYLTKHAVGIYGVEPPARPWGERDPGAAQAAVPTDRHPQLRDPDGTEAVHVEAHAVRYDRDGPATGVVVCRLADGRRCLAQASGDGALLEQLAHDDCVGAAGEVTSGEPVNAFRFA
jgi:acetyl-CoA C-acetyltransferase